MIGSLVSIEYQLVLRAMHASTNWGTHGFEYIDKFMPFFQELGCATLLDYGSGSESLRVQLKDTYPDIEVHCYDPGVAGRDTPPEAADFVVCTDVLEHVEEVYIDNVIDHIHSLMLLGGYLRIATSRAKRILPDGRNAHILQKPRRWWISKFIQHGYKIVNEGGGSKTVIIYVKKK